ncbi:ABC transporter substrate-binding protein [Adlercreutzia sp. ZJ141]|uniref:ABC transporter substrate-binding protein n=1 Tax=Adlercreutzia sp. ZJ141 TaxID=2709406 RepID=UPI0013ECA3E7|nr:ABC transporter substrate-binding protein [Adlercreutzia sp. ZJ141]
MENISRRKFVGLSATAAAAAAVALSGCSSEEPASTTEPAAEEAPATEEKPAEKKTIRLGTTNDGHIFNAIAEKNGYLEDAGVNVEVSVFNSSDDAFAALFSDKVDVLSNNGTNLPLTHVASGQDLTIYAGYMINGCMPIIAKKGTKWNGVEDLVGKTIACSGNEFAVFGPFYDAGHTMDEVETIVLSNHADRVEAVRTGKADYAICGTSQNYTIQQLADEIDVMAYCSDITPNYSCCRVDSRQAFLDENPEAVTAMLVAWMRAQDWYEQHRDETAEIVVEQTGSTVDYVKAYMDNEHYDLDLDPYKSSVIRAWDWMMEMGLFPEGAEGINIEDHIDTSLYKAALDECTEKYGAESKAFYDKRNEIFEEYNA